MVGIAAGEGVDRQLELDLRARVLLDEGPPRRGALGRLDGADDLGGPVHGLFLDLRRGGRLVSARGAAPREGNLSAGDLSP